MKKFASYCKHTQLTSTKMSIWQLVLYVNYYLFPGTQDVNHFGSAVFVHQTFALWGHSLLFRRQSHTPLLRVHPPTALPSNLDLLYPPCSSVLIDWGQNLITCFSEDMLLGWLQLSIKVQKGQQEYWEYDSQKYWLFTLISKNAATSKSHFKKLVALWILMERWRTWILRSNYVMAL